MTTLHTPATAATLEAKHAEISAEIASRDSEVPELALLAHDGDADARASAMAVLARIADLKKELNFIAIALPAAVRRDAQAATHRSDDSLTQSIDTLDGFRRDLSPLLPRLRAAAAANPEVDDRDDLERAYVLCRQIYGLSNAIASVFEARGDRPQARSYRVAWKGEDEFGPELAKRVPYFHPLAGKPDIPQPWKALIATAKGEGA